MWHLLIWPTGTVTLPTAAVHAAWMLTAIASMLVWLLVDRLARTAMSAVRVEWALRCLVLMAWVAGALSGLVAQAFLLAGHAWHVWTLPGVGR